MISDQAALFYVIIAKKTGRINHVAVLTAIMRGVKIAAWKKGMKKE